MAYVRDGRADRGRLGDCRRRLNESPLGCRGARRHLVPDRPLFHGGRARFDRPARTSLDAVSDRDFAIEFLGARRLPACISQRFAEEIVIWSSNEFAYRVDAMRSTPAARSCRRNATRIASRARPRQDGPIWNGSLVALLTVMKGLPLAYGKGYAGGQVPVFEAVDALELASPAMTGIVAEHAADRGRLRMAAEDGFATATDLPTGSCGSPVSRSGKRITQQHDRQTGGSLGLQSRGAALGELQARARRSPPAVYDVLDAGRSVASRNQLWRYRPRSASRCRQRARQKVSFWNEVASAAGLSHLGPRASCPPCGRDARGPPLHGHRPLCSRSLLALAPAARGVPRSHRRDEPNTYPRPI